ncbi:outer membrane protein [Serratia sp. UGAL515B_01]|uniref:outer membrane protein n=1 Tax=Serratia sp. UGAL515B_01 TaxID=2986763 RepID=UPI002954D5A9|nr:outer membrane beta-barrel protein [Serratia sp. UGAL515B_01]WON78266.1 outer membrane beta-barrel protein [Serratia sp. UGAL515B_01]
MVKCASSTFANKSEAYHLVFAQTKIVPYVKGGIGLASNKSTARLNIDPLFGKIVATLDEMGNGCKGSSTWCYPDARRNNFAWSLGIGAAYPITDNLFAGLDYQYINLGKAGSGIDSNGDSVRVKSIQNNEFSFKLGYQF